MADAHTTSLVLYSSPIVASHAPLPQLLSVFTLQSTLNVLSIKMFPGNPQIKFKIDSRCHTMSRQRNVTCKRTFRVKATTSDISRGKYTPLKANMASKKIAGLFGTSNKTFKFSSANVITRNVHDVITDSGKKVTHTGQIYDEDDYRNARFVNRPKEVNNNWAIKLIAEVPPAATKDRIVACNGGGGPLGHPKVYINLDKPGNHTCGYCGLRFYKEDHH